MLSDIQVAFGTHRLASVSLHAVLICRVSVDAPAGWSWDSLAPSGSIPFAWDDVTGREVLEVAAGVLGPDGIGAGQILAAGRRNMFVLDLETIQVWLDRLTTCFTDVGTYCILCCRRCQYLEALDAQAVELHGMRRRGCGLVHLRGAYLRPLCAHSCTNLVGCWKPMAATGHLTATVTTDPLVSLRRKNHT